MALHIRAEVPSSTAAQCVARAVTGEQITYGGLKGAVVHGIQLSERVRQALDPQPGRAHLVDLPVDPAREQEQGEETEHDQDPPVRPHSLPDLDQRQRDDDKHTEGDEQFLVAVAPASARAHRNTPAGPGRNALRAAPPA